MRQVHVLRGHQLPPWMLDDLLEPAVVEQGYCDCEVPDIRPLGGWWPVSFTCCHQCQRPVA